MKRALCSPAFKRMLVSPSSSSFIINNNNNISKCYYSSLATSPASFTFHPDSNDITHNHTTLDYETIKSFRPLAFNSEPRQFCSSSNRDWRDKFLNTFDFSTVLNNKKVENVLYEWRNDWECYWNESEVLDPSKDYVFKHQLELWNCGIVHSPKHFEEFGDDVNYSELYDDFSLLEELNQLATANGATWNPSGYKLFPVVIKFEKRKNLTPIAVLEALYAHEQLKNPDVIVDHLITDDKEGAFTKRIERANQTIQDWFKRNFGNTYVAFQTGSQVLNPVPWICVGKTQNGNLIGLISAIDIPKHVRAINWDK